MTGVLPHHPLRKNQNMQDLDTCCADVNADLLRRKASSMPISKICVNSKNVHLSLWCFSVSFPGTDYQCQLLTKDDLGSSGVATPQVAKYDCPKAKSSQSLLTVAAPHYTVVIDKSRIQGNPEENLER